MNWEVEYLPEAESDLKSLDGSQRILVLKAIKKVKQNPLPVYEGGYGKPLGNKNGNDLTGFLKVKLKSAGLRVVYKVVKQNDKMLIIVIGARADEEVYGIAQKRGSFANVGVVKSICKQVQTAAYQGSNHGISATGGFTSHGYSCRNRVSFVN